MKSVPRKSWWPIVWVGVIDLLPTLVFFGVSMARLQFLFPHTSIHQRELVSSAVAIVLSGTFIISGVGLYAHRTRVGLLIAATPLVVLALAAGYIAVDVMLWHGSFQVQIVR